MPCARSHCQPVRGCVSDKAFARSLGQTRKGDVLESEKQPGSGPRRYGANILRCLGQLAILWGISWGCNRFVGWAHWPLPGNVLGVLVLFSLLCLGVIRLEQVERTADFLLRHLVFFFIPIAVGLMEWGEVFSHYGMVLFAAILISSLLPLLSVGFVTLLLHRKR
ncbi:CidA/LrgA family protein [Desulfovibrio sp. JY]|nr:CidA/LrgA family protein [Desulfovibrio sp. JY]